MRTFNILFLLLFLIPISSFSANISCYNNGMVIYKGNGTAMDYEDNYIAFFDIKSQSLVVVSADCVVKYEKDEKIDLPN